MSDQSIGDSNQNQSKRKHSVEEESNKKADNSCDQQSVTMSDKMDEKPNLSRGRGRGLLKKNLNKLKIESNRPIGQSSNSLLAELGGDSLRPTDTQSAKKLKEAEERSGISLDILTEFFKIDGNVGQLLEQKGYNFGHNQWSNGSAVKDEIKKEVKTEEEVEEKKVKGQQYVEEIRQREKMRIIQSQREEKQRKSAETSSSSPNAEFRHHANRTRNTSNLSLTTMTTDVESVGTYLPQIPDTIAESENMGSLINQYFGESKPKRNPLPISQYETRILQSVRANRVVIIEGATGCGKTTQVPQYIADECAAMGLPFNIVVTQPRRIAAKSIAQRVADERNWQLGTIVGYQIGMDRSHVNEDTRILYCTTGVLLQRLINTQKMDMYSHIIVDEVHERSIETDLLLLVIKKLMMTTGIAVKIILMSATFDATKLKEYFTIPIYSVEDEEEEVVNEVRPSHIRVEERPNQLNIYYFNEIKSILRLPVMQTNRFDPLLFNRENPCVSSDQMEVALKILEEGLEKVEEGSDNRGSVLVFLPGLEEIHEMKARLDRSIYKDRNKWKIYPLHSSVPLDRQNEIFYKPRNRERKIILATNIAESSITVPDVEYVIDFCLTKNLVCDLETHIPVLRMEWAAKSNCDQRAGRAGRVTEGRVYRLVQKEFYSNLQPYGYPELVRSPLDLSILRVKMLNMGPPKELLGLALDPPDLSDIYRSVLQLKQCGAFTVRLSTKDGPIYDEEDGDITTLGIVMSHLPVDIRLGKLVVMGHVFDVLEDCIIIASCLSTQGMFRRDFSQGLSAYKSRLAWADRSFSDSIAFLNAYKMYKSFDSVFGNNKQVADKWCKQNFLQYKRILEVDYMIGEIRDRLRHENIFVPIRPNFRRKRNEEELILKVVMCAAFYPNYFLRQEIQTESIPKMISTKDPYNTTAIHGLPQNQGVIYAPQIKQLFSICSKQIDLSFEDTKAYMTFLDDRYPLKEAHDLQQLIDLTDGRETPMSSTSGRSNSNSVRAYKDTAIKTAVYVAIAMRSHREINKDIFKYDGEVAKIKVERINKVKKEETDKWQTLQTNRISVPMVLSRVKLAKLQLPAMDCSEIEIRITHIEDPGNFYAQYDHSITNKALDELSAIINYELETIPCDETSLRFGDIVIAPYKGPDNSMMFGRARVDNIEYKGNTKEIEQIQVFFIDYGFTEYFRDIRKLNQISSKTNSRLTTLAPQAFKCQLSQVNPSPIVSPDGLWNRKSIEFFKSQVRKHRTLTAKIYSVVDRVVRLELFEDVNRNQSINDKLISSGYAEKWDESPQSKINHEQRRKAQLTRDNTCGKFKLEPETEKSGIYNSDNTIEVEVDDEVPSTSSTRNYRSHEKFTIKGPYSPLECSFTGLTNKTCNRSVRIDRDSVNCVVLEPDYLSKHTRLLVASSIGLGQTTGNINLKDTTLMPNIRGFPALMALLFAPRVELRADKDYTEYVGAICGLGFDSFTKKSYDSDSDAEIIFDADISREDVVKINIIRYHVSDLLKSREQLRDFADGMLAIKQRKVRRLVIELLDRRRRMQDNSSYHPNFKWGSIPECNLSDRDISQSDHLLPIIDPLRMQDFDWFEDIRHNLELLKEVQLGSTSTTTKCKLCKFNAYTLQDITYHLTSNQHIDAVNDFNKYYKMNEDEKLKQQYYSQRQDEDEEVIDVFDSDDE